MKKEILIDEFGDEYWIVQCKNCGREMQHCEDFEPPLCARCVFGGKDESNKKIYKAT